MPKNNDKCYERTVDTTRWTSIAINMQNDAPLYIRTSSLIIAHLTV